MSDPWVVRVARVDVTPPLGLPMDGYADRTLPADGVLDPLEVNVAVLEDRAEERIAWVSLDGIAVTATLRRGLAVAVADAAGLDATRVIVAASHTHAGPAGWAGEIHPVLPAHVDEREVARVVGLVSQAVSASRPREAQLRYVEGTVAGAGANRHQKGGPHDTSCGVLSLMAGDTPLGVVFDYACHPTVLGPENTRWSADWVGPAREAVRRVAGPVPVVFLQGAAGDVSPRFVRQGRDRREAARLGSLVGAVLANLVGQGDPLASRLRFKRWDASLPTRQDVPPMPAAISADPDRLAASRREGYRSQVALRRSELADRLGVPMSLLELGSRRWLHAAAEVFASTALELRAADEQLRVIGYCDGYCGYLADAAAHARGEYEALASFFDAAETRRFVDDCAAQVGSW